MSWLNRSKKLAPIQIRPPAQSRVEVELHKDATKEAATQAQEANKHLKELLEANGFTLKIYIAAGGKPPKKRSGELTR